MEEGAILADEGRKIEIILEGERLVIGESPQLIVNLDSQENYIVVDGEKHPYLREVALSEDLLEGKRQNVLESAVWYYYDQACRIAEGMKAAREYRSKLSSFSK